MISTVEAILFSLLRRCTLHTLDSSCSYCSWFRSCSSGFGSRCSRFRGCRCCRLRRGLSAAKVRLGFSTFFILTRSHWLSWFFSKQKSINNWCTVYLTRATMARSAMRTRVMITVSANESIDISRVKVRQGGGKRVWERDTQRPTVETITLSTLLFPLPLSLIHSLPLAIISKSELEQSEKGRIDGKETDRLGKTVKNDDHNSDNLW